MRPSPTGRRRRLPSTSRCACWHRRYCIGRSTVVVRTAMQQRCLHCCNGTDLSTAAELAARPPRAGSLSGGDGGRAGRALVQVLRPGCVRVFCCAGALRLPDVREEVAAAAGATSSMEGDVRSMRSRMRTRANRDMWGAKRRSLHGFGGGCELRFSPLRR